MEIKYKSLKVNRLHIKIKIMMLIFVFVGLAVIYYSLQTAKTKTTANEFTQKKNLPRKIAITEQPSEQVMTNTKDLQIKIPVNVESPKEPDNAVKLKSNQLDNGKMAGVSVQRQNSSLNHSSQITSLPLQVFEVLPEKKDNRYVGSVQLKLKIDEKGKVIEHTILFDSLECEDCLKEIIAAAYKSRWEPGMKNGIPSEYWIKKTYSFN